MRFWFDTEFIEDGKTIELISIGVFSEDRRKFYAEAAECDLSRASPWVVENVLPHLSGRKTPRSEIARQLVEFMGDAPEIWAYYADYDWVVLCQLFGTMIELPKGWPMYCRDVKQLADSLGNPPLPKQESIEHNAMADAIWTAQSWRYLNGGAWCSWCGCGNDAFGFAHLDACRRPAALAQGIVTREGQDPQGLGEAEGRVEPGPKDAPVKDGDIPIPTTVKGETL